MEKSISDMNTSLAAFDNLKSDYHEEDGLVKEDTFNTLGSKKLDLQKVEENGRYNSSSDEEHQDIKDQLSTHRMSECSNSAERNSFRKKKADLLSSLSSRDQKFNHYFKYAQQSQISNKLAQSKLQVSNAGQENEDPNTQRQHKPFEESKLKSSLGLSKFQASGLHNKKVEGIKSKLKESVRMRETRQRIKALKDNSTIRAKTKLLLSSYFSDDSDEEVKPKPIEEDFDLEKKIDIAHQEILQKKQGKKVSGIRPSMMKSNHSSDEDGTHPIPSHRKQMQSIIQEDPNENLDQMSQISDLSKFPPAQEDTPSQVFKTFDLDASSKIESDQKEVDHDCRKAQHISNLELDASSLGCKEGYTNNLDNSQYQDYNSNKYKREGVKTTKNSTDSKLGGLQNLGGLSNLSNLVDMSNMELLLDKSEDKQEGGHEGAVGELNIGEMVEQEEARHQPQLEQLDTLTQIKLTSSSAKKEDRMIPQEQYQIKVQNQQFDQLVNNQPQETIDAGGRNVGAFTIESTISPNYNSEEFDREMHEERIKQQQLNQKNLNHEWEMEAHNQYQEIERRKLVVYENGQVEMEDDEVDGTTAQFQMDHHQDYQQYINDDQDQVDHMDQQHHHYEEGQQQRYVQEEPDQQAYPMQTPKSTFHHQRHSNPIHPQSHLDGLTFDNQAHHAQRYSDAFDHKYVNNFQEDQVDQQFQQSDNMPLQMVGQPQQYEQMMPEQTIENFQGQEEVGITPGSFLDNIVTNDGVRMSLASEAGARHLQMTLDTQEKMEEEKMYGIEWQEQINPLTDVVNNTTAKNTSHSIRAPLPASVTQSSMKCAHSSSNLSQNFPSQHNTYNQIPKAQSIPRIQSSASQRSLPSQIQGFIQDEQPYIDEQQRVSRNGPMQEAQVNRDVPSEMDEYRKDLFECGGGHGQRYEEHSQKSNDDTQGKIVAGRDSECPSTIEMKEEEIIDHIQDLEQALNIFNNEIQHMKGVFEEIGLGHKSILNQLNSMNNSINDPSLTIHEFKQSVAQRTANIKSETEHILQQITNTIMDHCKGGGAGRLPRQEDEDTGQFQQSISEDNHIHEETPMVLKQQFKEFQEHQTMEQSLDHTPEILGKSRSYRTSKMMPRQIDSDHTSKISSKIIELEEEIKQMRVREQQQTNNILNLINQNGMSNTHTSQNSQNTPHNAQNSFGHLQAQLTQSAPQNPLGVQSNLSLSQIEKLYFQQSLQQALINQGVKNFGGMGQIQGRPMSQQAYNQDIPQQHHDCEQIPLTNKDSIQPYHNNILLSSIPYGSMVQNPNDLSQSIIQQNNLSALNPNLSKINDGKMLIMNEGEGHTHIPTEQMPMRSQEEFQLNEIQHTQTDSTPQTDIKTPSTISQQISDQVTSEAETQKSKLIEINDKLSSQIEENMRIFDNLNEALEEKDTTIKTNEQQLEHKQKEINKLMNKLKDMSSNMQNLIKITQNAEIVSKAKAKEHISKPSRASKYDFSKIDKIKQNQNKLKSSKTDKPKVKSSKNGHKQPGLNKSTAASRAKRRGGGGKRSSSRGRPKQQLENIIEDKSEFGNGVNSPEIVEVLKQKYEEYNSHLSEVTQAIMKQREQIMDVIDQTPFRDELNDSSSQVNELEEALKQSSYLLKSSLMHAQSRFKDEVQPATKGRLHRYEDQSSIGATDCELSVSKSNQQINIEKMLGGSIFNADSNLTPGRKAGEVEKGKDNPPSLLSSAFEQPTPTSVFGNHEDELTHHEPENAIIGQFLTENTHDDQ